MSNSPIFSSTAQNSPRQQRNGRQKGRTNRQNWPIYLTDGHISSSDLTNGSGSEISLMKIEWEGRVKKLQKENNQLRETIITLKASQFYERDEEKIKSIIRQNQSLRSKIQFLQSDMKLLDQELSTILVQNEYLKRNNKALKQDLQQLVKENVRQRHNYFTNSSRKIKSPNHYEDENLEVSRLRSQSKDKNSQKLAMLVEKKKTIQREIYKEKQARQEKDKYFQEKDKYFQQQREKHKTSIEHQQPIQHVVKPNKPTIKCGNKSRNGSSSKSREKLLLNSFVGTKGLLKKPKKQGNQMTSTGQSQGLTGPLRSSSRMRTQMKSRESYLPTSRSPNAYEGNGANDYAKRKAQLGSGRDYNEDYYLSKRQIGGKKKNVYYV